LRGSDFVSFEDSLHAAVGEDALAEVASNNLCVIVVLDEHAAVHFEVNESKVEEVSQSFAGNFVFDAGSFVVVDLFGRLEASFSDRLVERALLLTSGLVARFHVDVGVQTRVLLLDLLGDVLKSVGNILRNDGSKGLVSLLHLDFRSFDQDISPDFVSEAVVVTGDHSEVALVAAFLLGSSELDFPDVLLVSDDSSTHGHGSSLHIISVGLDEEGVLGPGGLSVVTEGPLFGELGARNNFVLVAEAFFDKAS